MSTSATDRTRQLLIDAAASTRHDDTDASSETQLSSWITLQNELEDELRHQIRVARSMGMTWQQIGDQFGTSRQAAQQRWS